MSYSVIGDPVNIAARLCSTAGPGQVLVSHDTYAKISNHFEVKKLEPVSVKGKAKPVRVYQVLGRKTSPYLPGTFFRDTR
jgi:adenylate cyclase